MTATTDRSVRVDAAMAIGSRGLTKRFAASATAVDGIDLVVPAGSVYGFLGPNGSGKTTTIRMVLGLIAPTDGEVTLLGERMPAGARRALPRVGALVEGPAFHPYLSGRANLRRLDAADATADPRTRGPRMAAALERVGLGAAADKRYRQYSLGMKQRLGIAAALLVPRDLLVLDEPTNGLDPQGTREIRTLVRDLASDGTTVLVSSHLLAEVAQIASHVGIMSAGKLVAQGRLGEVLGAADAGGLEIRTPDPERATEVLTGLGLRVTRAEADTPPGEDGRAPVLRVTGDVPAERVAAALVDAGVRLRGLAEQHAALEDLFVALTGEGFDVRA